MDVWRQSVGKLRQGHPEKITPVEALLNSSESAHTWIQIQYTPAQLLKRPRFCNVCREKLTGFPQHGWSCDVCKIKTHRKCMNHVADKCKWTVECLIPHHLQYISPENSIMPHQWVEGNISPSSRCAVCDRNCGSALRLQDWRCLWCACTVHDGCLAQLGRGCNLGPFSISCVPPLSVNEVSADGEYKFRWDAIGSECGGSSPLCVMVNSKSGDSQGQRMIRKFKRLLNPIQIFDIISSGPDFALSLFKSLDSFRVLVCGGDGTVGWVLTAMDRLDLHKKCQLAVLPLGTGNDLARVLGWGHAFYNVHELPSLLQEIERAPTSMLDRWGVMIMDGPSANAIKLYETRLKEQLRRVLFAEEPHEVIQSVRLLCGTIKELMKDVEATYSKVEEWERQTGNPTNDPVTGKCATLMAKLDNLMKSLDKHSDVPTGESGFEADPEENVVSEERQRRDSLVCRANSLKKAIKDIMDMAEKGLDQHIRDSGSGSGASAKRAKFRTKRSKTTPTGLKVSASNLSSSSACSPPVSPSIRRDRLTVDRAAETPLTGTSGYGASPAPDFSLAPSTEPQEISTNGCVVTEDSESENASANIGYVQPPTPSSTREQSTANEPDRPPLDGERLFKPMSECQLFSAEPADIKLSHSDSSIFEHSGSGRSNVRLREGRLDHHRVEKEKNRRSAQESKAKFLFELMNALDHPYLLSSGLSDLPLLGPPTNSIYRKTAHSSPPSPLLREEKKADNFVVGGSLIAEVLLLNASVLGMAQGGIAGCISPLDTYKETKVMNNYFGIGLDAKIALDFHNKREGSEKTRSRSKLFLWYGMLGGRELMHRTYRNLDQRIRLECDGVPIDLPSLQGIVILNIPSYSGGANFWGTAKEEGFVAQSFDDRLLEVVALFGVMHVATSRVPNVVRLQNHRIAQCRHVRIVILGNEPIPVQVDGEPWMQSPGILQIVHKNRAQLLVRDPAFDATLKKWEEQKERSTAPSTPTAVGITFARRAGEFIRLVESEIANLGVSSAFLEAMDTATNALQTAEQTGGMECTNYDERSYREEVLAAVEQVVDLLEAHFGWPENKVPANQPRLGPAPHFNFEIHGAEPDQWRYVISCIRQEISREEASLRELCQLTPPSYKKRSRIATWITKQWRRRGRQPGDSVSAWSVDEVSSWLSSLGLPEYSEQFKANDVRGAELLHLEKADLNDLGVTKIGHIKRLQTAIDDLLEAEKQRRRSGRKGVSLSVERHSAPTIEPPSLSSL